MRLVVDTNVFISAALKDISWPSHTVRWLSKYDGLLKSTAVEDELFAVLGRPRFADKIAPVFLEEVQRIFASAERVSSAAWPEFGPPYTLKTRLNRVLTKLIMVSRMPSF